MLGLLLLLLFLGFSPFLAAGDGVECTHPFITVGGRCVYIDPWQTGTLDQVRAICKSHSGDVIWFDNDADCDFYRDLLAHIHENSLNEKNYWMGITDEKHDQVWKYLRNNVVVRDGPPYWYTGFPTTSTSKNCAVFSKVRSYYWEEVACSGSASMICRQQ